MKTLQSYLCGEWYAADTGFSPLVDPSTEVEIARISSHGADFAAALDFARSEGGSALRRLSFVERGALLKDVSKLIRSHREELLELSRINTGTTVADGSFDIDGAGGTLAVYAGLARRIRGNDRLADGDGTQLARTEAFWGQHMLVPRRGVAVHVNAFNFPAWGLAEKLACAILAGMPVITKPASATAMVAARLVEIIVEANVLPAGSLQMICGSTGNLLDLLGAQDVLAFTGSADTAARLRDRDNFRRTNTRVNVEADSLNAAVLGPGASDSTTALFVKEVAREMVQKSGQKCTAIRRIIVPSDRLAEIEAALVARLEKVVTGNPAEETVTMGPLATANQLRDTQEGLAELGGEATRIFGSGARIDGVGSPAGKGFFVGPNLFRADRADDLELVHSREVFGPCATLMPASGDAAATAEIVARGGGTLVTSVYDDDLDWSNRFVAEVAPFTGRIYVGSEGSAPAAPGSGLVFPQSQHGGPGRAGGGEELGGMDGLRPYLQRVAVQGERGLVGTLTEVPVPATDG